MGFSGSVNGTTKNPRFWILVFANVNGPIVLAGYTRMYHTLSHNLLL